jgi:DNA-binding cell septation regulator SpoVG
VCVVVGHIDRPAQQSNQFVTDVQIIVKMKKMIIVLIMPSSREDDYGDYEDIIYGNEKGTRTLIYVAISSVRNVIKEEDEEILKYKDLTIGLQRIWKVKKTSDTR